MDQESLDAAMRRLIEERRRLESLRTDYAHIMRSRFHGLRMFWFSLKAMLGLPVAGDRYAVWSPGMALSVGEVSPRVLAEKPLPRSPGHLQASWKNRLEQHPLNAEKPIVSVIIPVYNNVDVTARCLQSITDTWFASMQVQIIVVDDGSTDATPELLASLPGLDYVRLSGNHGFVRACNRGAGVARGTYICFLNNDTVVRDAWLDLVVPTLENDSTIGAAGSKLVYPDGKLQEAGNIIWRDGTGWNYGRGENPEDPRYNYVREVDYCSGAALLVRRALFEQLGGFSEEYVPAYYEDADLCFGIRSLGFRVVYQPHSEVVHYEGLTSGTDLSSGTKRFQEVNRPKFQRKWAAALEQQYEPDPASVPAAARRGRGGPTILVVDSYVPMHDRDAGSNRLMRILHILRAARYHVIFLPDNYAPLQPYTTELQNFGVEVLHHIEGGLPWQASLNSVLPVLDLAWVCRPDLFAKYEPLIRHNRATRVIYDTIDLHFMRKVREIAVHGGDPNDSKEIERMELDAAKRADATVVVTESEKKMLRERGVENVFVVPTIHELEIERERRFSESSGILFIGGYNHPPNVDAARWLHDEIMPLLWKRNPNITLTLLGSNPPDSVLAMESERVRVPGFVSDVRPYFLNARIFVAPLRYGAGMNGKVGHALSYRLPLVLTEMAADGFGLTDGRNCLIANDAGRFAEAIARLYDDEQLWTKLSRSADDVLGRFGRSAVAPGLLRALEELCNSEPAGVAYSS
jgi:GT2 family glycosyltransferase